MASNLSLTGSNVSVDKRRDNASQTEVRKEDGNTARTQQETTENNDEKDTFSKSTAIDVPKGGSKVRQKPKPSTASKLEDQMNFEHLKKLETIFQEADADDGGGLDIDEFREAMKKTMGSEIDDKELEILFMKVDTNCDGTVDWDEYLSYMLLEYQEKDTMTSLIKEVPFPNPLRELPSNHRDNVISIKFFQNLSNKHANKALDRDNPGGKYLVLSKEGQLGFYNIDYELQKTITIGSASESCVPLWLTDLTACPNVNMVAISSTEREISFYDVSANKFDRQFQLTGFRDPVFCMSYWFDHEDLNNSTLVVGDANGSVIVLRFVEATRKGLFGVYPQKGVVQKVSLISILKHRVSGAYCLMYPHLHSNWVNSAQYFQLAQGLECFISCSSTDDDSMYLGDLSNITYKAKWPGFCKLRSNRGCFYRVRKGILALDYSKDWNIIVTGSFDGVVRTWNPYSAKPASLIKGHLTPVQHVRIIQGSGQVITCGKDRTLRIIELRDHTTTQVLGPRSFVKMGPTSHTINCIFYQKRYKALLIGTMQVGLFEGFDDNEKVDQLNIKSHDGPVSTVLYNKLFNQVVTAGHDSVLSVWDLNTGTKAIQFHTIKGVELTCMCFDQTGRRLITGSRNGAVKIWNFNNGACLRTLSGETNYEVTGLVCLKQKIISGGWNKKLTVYIDSRNQDDEDDSREWQEVHKDDVLCLASFQHSNGVSIIASSSYDGDIFIWSLDSGHILCRLNRMESYSPLSIDGFKMNKSEPYRNTDQATTPNIKTRSDRQLESPLTQNNTSTKRSNANLSVPGHEKNVLSSELLPPIHQPSKLCCRNEKKEVVKDRELSLPKIMEPSARSTVSTEHTRHQLDVITGENTQDYWAADVSIDKLIFLQSRPHKPHAATLLSSGAMGWVHAWSVHPQGGLLGQFVAAHRDGESVLSMATDEQNKILITGDSSGYVTIWDIETYCYKQPVQQRRRGAAFDLLQIRLQHDNQMTEESVKMLSQRRMLKLNIIPPNVVQYFRAHVGSVNDINYINEKELFLTSCSDGTVRLWTIGGMYIGTFGQKHQWNLSTQSIGQTRMPADIKRVASANTLKVFNAGYSAWRLARNVLNFVALRGITKAITRITTARPSIAEAKKEEYSEVNSLFFNEVKTDEEIERNYQRTVKKMGESKVLGGWYKAKRRHRVLPKIDLKPHLNNFRVHSSIPFSPLQVTEDVAVPELLKEKWRMQREVMQGMDQETKSRPAKSSVKGILSKSWAARKNRSSQISFSNTSQKISKAVKVWLLV
ncbi:WD repeat-containing protein on Y chromosome-like [Ciona intestinalis]